MKRIIANRLACWTMFGFLAAVVATIGQPGWGADADQPAAKTTKKERKEQKWKGQLPPHYKNVVTEEQKEKIYAIQAEFGPKIRDLQKQLEALKAQQKDKIEAMLTREQKEQIKKAEVEAKEKRKGKKAAKFDAVKPVEKDKATTDKPAEKDKTPPAESKPAT
jgi:hypothetical protein